MLSITPKDIMILGGGLELGESGLRLSPRSVERVERAVRFMKHPEMLGAPATLICSGGFSKVNLSYLPDEAQTESRLMADALMAEGVDHRRIIVETKSGNTVENFTQTVLQGIVNPDSYDPEYPLGIVTQGWHWSRVLYIASLAHGRVPTHLRLVDAGREGQPQESYRQEGMKILQEIMDGALGAQAVQDRVPRLEAAMQERFRQRAA